MRAVLHLLQAHTESFPVANTVLMAVSTRSIFILGGRKAAKCQNFVVCVTEFGDFASPKIRGWVPAQRFAEPVVGRAFARPGGSLGRDDESGCKRRWRSARISIDSTDQR
jgi:hypothetical protein